MERTPRHTNQEPSRIRTLVQGLAKTPELSSIRAGFIGAFGIDYKSCVLTPAELSELHETFRRQQYIFPDMAIEPDDFFPNRQSLALCSHELLYAEGFVCRSDSGPVAHGWLVLNGKVIDITTPWNITGSFNDAEYLGVALRTDWLREQTARRGQLHEILRPEYNGTLFVDDPAAMVCTKPEAADAEKQGAR